MARKRNILTAFVIGLMALLALGNVTKSAAQSQPWLVEGNQGNAQLGQTVAPAGDVNGDGYGDLLIAGRHDFGNGLTGVAYAYYGSAQGLDTQPAWAAVNEQPYQYAQIALASAGDVNGDGYDDVIVGDRFFSGDQMQEGRVYLYYGSPGGLSSTPGWIEDGNQSILYFGTAVAGAGDVNGDGYDDVLISAPYKRDPTTGDVIGQVLLYLGSPSGLSSKPAWTASGTGGWTSFGDRLNAAGDVNGDGYADFMASDFFFTDDQQAEGRVYLYYGSPNGPAPGPAWTADGNQANDYFGMSLAPAGDVNGDGYDDVVIGAPSYSDPESIEGQALLYYGSASGLGSAAGWTAEGDQYGAYLGNAVSSAGDVNGDGYGDVVVGAYGFTNGELEEGRAFLYLGSASGLATSSAWTGEGDQALAGFGSSVSSAGDVNGDGHAEWAVGAPQYDRGEGNEGIAVVFDSLAAGPLPTPPPVTPSPTPTPTILQLHVSDLDGSANPTHKTWTALVNVEVSRANGFTVDQAVVSGTWSTGDTSQCTTGVYGVCTMRLSGLPKKVGSVTFTVNDVQRSQGIYEPSANSDPDGDSNGTQITVAR
jgi:FG-GAP repeat